jgi:tRNA (guanine37-N1)-methyltransferase
VPLRFDILTTFPEMFAPTPPGVLGVSIPARALAAGLIEVHATNIRDFTLDRHQKTDDRPFGGGPGMVMMCQPLWDAVRAVESRDSVSPARPCTRILLTPQGEPLRQQLVEEFATKPRLLLIAGHYEGLDERVIEALAPHEVSLGDYVLSGGELAALVLIDAITRLIPGATGDQQSPAEDSFGRLHPPPSTSPNATSATASPAPGVPSLPSDQRLLDCPHYTKPREWMGRTVPEVLLSGDHQRIAQWRLDQRLKRTMLRRPDLLRP